MMLDTAYGTIRELSQALDPSTIRGCHAMPCYLPPSTAHYIQASPHQHHWVDVLGWQAPQQAQYTSITDFLNWHLLQQHLLQQPQACRAPSAQHRQAHTQTSQHELINTICKFPMWKVPHLGSHRRAGRRLHSAGKCTRGLPKFPKWHVPHLSSHRRAGRRLRSAGRCTLGGGRCMR